MKLSKKDMVTTLFVTASAFIYAFGISNFVKPGNLFPGGFSGISRLLSAALADFCHIDISFGVFYFGLNILTSLLVFRFIGKKFLFFSILHYTLTSLFSSLIPNVFVTGDLLLISIFGGLINGFAIGLALQHDASSGGTDFIAIYFSTKYNKPTWNYILAFNACILVVAGLMYGWDRALYSIIFQFMSTQVVNMLHKRYTSSQLDVVTNKPDEICSAVFHICRHGITKIPCKGGFTDQDHWMLVIAVNDYQLKDVLDGIKGADPEAFITLSSVDRIIGNYYQKPLE